ncbi:MAG: hypothetical protein ACK55I_14365, partial [bacterium]
MHRNRHPPYDRRDESRAVEEVSSRNDPPADGKLAVDRPAGAGGDSGQRDGCRGQRSRHNLPG